MEERLKVLIVDDEPIARKFLRVCIDWEAAGFTISAEAGGGAEALDLMEVDTPILYLRTFRCRLWMA